MVMPRFGPAHALWAHSRLRVSPGVAPGSLLDPARLSLGGCPMAIFLDAALTAMRTKFVRPDHSTSSVPRIGVNGGHPAHQTQGGVWLV